MSNTKLQTKVLNDEMKGVLDSLELDEFTEDDVTKTLQEAIENLKKPSLEWKKKIDFNSKESFKEDFAQLREYLFETIDTSKKIQDLSLDVLAVSPANLDLIQAVTESVKLVQTSIKSMTDLHSSFHKIYSQKVRTDIVEGLEVESKQEENVDAKGNKIEFV